MLGVILKLALYGYLRIILQYLPDATNYFAPLIQTFCIISLIYSSFVTIRQTDFKKLVAYSSVAHAATIILGTFSNTISGIEGAILLGLAHGIVSPALFFLVGGVLYDRFHTRTIRYYAGLVIYIPIFSIFFLLFSLSNAAVPLSANFIGELMCLLGIFQENQIISVISSLSVVISAVYCIFLFNRLSFGNYSKYINFILDLNRREFIIIVPLLFFTFVMGIIPNLILSNLHSSVANLIYNALYYCISVLLYYFIIV